MALHEVIKITDSFFWLTYVENTGAAFSMSFGSELFNRIFFIVVSVLIILLIIYMSKKSDSKTEQVAFAMIIGGAIGNLIDRILIGSVTDFIWWDFFDLIMERWPVFNLADSAIVVAVVLIVIKAVFDSNKKVEEQ
jgi:signal peptidase II